MSDFKAKMHQIRFRLGLCLRPRWRSWIDYKSGCLANERRPVHRAWTTRDEQMSKLWRAQTEPVRQALRCTGRRTIRNEYVCNEYACDGVKTAVCRLRVYSRGHSLVSRSVQCPVCQRTIYRWPTTHSVPMDPSLLLSTRRPKHSTLLLQPLNRQDVLR